ncbi:feruloyl esterase [Ameyamaea chiangmaiensis NBRC 103196]|uniref:Tannase/feruloyl esterase family alpha/beta hydrolase n=1 Tax=Ameyamaea chiangmaiensis TaxID=442969 RepID=A0A850PEK7_9PROT|nr:tannase/feruloyl esterase family alpha/beta hydrolase [Ameyamaea chiangmaiensis]MBS4075621.1 tannase/feruloyl esterase family alpha/beta hydrolase [Ameyamaea chiangmaiensis]NVN40372.1 tannase/feruloyl esterase family alpha/beta hydrolase [Ameyamaea chiangmaiensis]GBQ70732.1 feruloyl esterase [Ameyamaea chiangmaiensis NBRC 103196]
MHRVVKSLTVLLIGLAAAHAAHAASACRPDSLQRVFGADVRLHAIEDWGASNLAAPKDGAEQRSVAGTDLCLVTGDMALGEGQDDRANFAGVLPTHWNGKILQVGCGGNCGTVFLGPAPLGWVSRGYAVWATDDGHVAHSSPAPRLWSVSESRWAVDKDGKPDQARQTAFFYRAVHGLAVQARQWTAAFYGNRPETAYFAGCSDGGREALVEAERYPDDFDGILAGDPYFDIEGEALSAAAGVLAQMRTPDAALTDEQWHLADQVMTERCDATDGVRDGLIQNPARCDFIAERDLPRCGADATGACFTKAQAQSLDIALSAMTDSTGHTVYPGYPSSNLADGGPMVDNLRYWLGFSTVPGGWRDAASQPQAWYYGNQTLRYLGGIDDPAISFSGTEGTAHAVVKHEVLATLQSRVAAGDGTDEKTLDAFLRAGHRLVLYHGLADGDITPYRTLNVYRALARRQGGYARLQQHAVLFAVPGMAHCGGGPGPNTFGQSGAVAAEGKPDGDVLSLLDVWVRTGHRPERLVASHAADGIPTNPVDRTMPLCPFPAMARYVGHGDVNDAENWRCEQSDQRMLASGPAGVKAGYSP